jgi:hypothetical protein
MIEMIEEVLATTLVWDGTIYPRKSIDGMHVSQLADAIRAGQTFPPVIAERGSGRIIDGVHRWTAFKQVCGAEGKILCEFREYDSDADLFLDAIHLNTAHGLGLDRFEQVKCILQLEKMGITRERAAEAMRMTFERAEKMIAGKTAYRALPEGGVEAIPLKGSMVAFRGQTLNDKQLAANRTGGGMRPRYYVDQLISMVEAGICKSADAELLKRLAELQRVLGSHLSRGKAARAS